MFKLHQPAAPGRACSRADFRRALTHRRILLATGAAGAVCLAAAASAQTTDVVAITGDAAPDGNGTFRNFGKPVLNDAGQLAFSANLDGTTGGGSDNAGIFRGDGLSPLVPIFHKGAPAPNGNGSILGFSVPVLNAAGQAATRMVFTGTGGGTSDDRGIFRGGVLALPARIAREGQLAPDGNGRFAFVDLPALNASGQVAFAGVFTGTSGGISDNAGVYLGDGATLVQIVRAGDAAPDGNGGFRAFGSTAAGLLALNDAGRVAFEADLTGTSGGSSDDNGIFLGGGGAPVIQIARAGQAAPDGNGSFSGVGAPALNNLGQTAFSASFTGTPGGAADNIAIIRADATGNLVQIVREGQGAPDGDGSFASFGAPSLNDSGQMAFTGVLTGAGGIGDTTGVFRAGGAGAVEQIARGGQTAPGGNGHFSLFRDPAINDAGQMAFYAVLSGTSGGSSDNEGIFFFDEQLGLLQVARRGDMLLGSTITSVDFSDIANSLGEEGTGLNDLGQVAFGFHLADGRDGVAIWTVPGPASLSLLAPFLLLRRRR